MFAFNVLSGSTIKQLLAERPERAIESVRKTYLAHEDGYTVNPDSYFLRFPKDPSSRIIALPAAIENSTESSDDAVSGIKWIASYPNNVQNGIPRASAVLVLNDFKTGYPYALLECSQISAVRTAASAVLGAFWMNGEKRTANTIAFIGAGVIARNIFDTFIADQWKFDSVCVHDSHAESMESFAKHAGSQTKTSVTAQSSLEEVLKADIVVFATNAGDPYVLDAGTFRPQQIVLNISLRDLGPDIILEAENLFDDVDHCMKASTSPHLAEQKVRNRGFVTGTLAQLMRGQIALNRTKPLIYSPFGMGILDLALGKDLFEEAMERGLTTAIHEFFGETSRW